MEKGVRMAKITKQAPRKKAVKKKVAAKGKAEPARPPQLQSLSEGLDQEGIKVNVYGPSATGKTTFWATFPGKILVLICSGGKNPGELLSINTPTYNKKIDKWHIHTPEDYDQAIEYLQDNPDIYQTAVLDHATGLQDLCLKEILGLDDIPEQKTWGLATQQEYGQMALQMKERLKRLLSLKQNIVVVAQERAFNTDDESSLLMPYVASALSPSVVGWLNPAVDYICETFKRRPIVVKELSIGGKKVKQKVPGDKIEYCMRVGPDDVYMTKFRVPKERAHTLPSVIVDPDYDKIMKIIKC